MKKLVLGLIIMALIGIGVGISAVARGSGSTQPDLAPPAPPRLPDIVATDAGISYHDAGTTLVAPIGVPAVTSDVAAANAWEAESGRAADATSEQVAFGTFLPPGTGVGMVAESALGYVVTFEHVCWHLTQVFDCRWQPMHVYISATSGDVLGVST